MYIFQLFRISAIRPRGEPEWMFTTKNLRDNLREERLPRYFSILLNGLSSETYACLSSHSPIRTPDDERLNDVQVVREALENMRYLSVPYVNPEGNRTKQPCFAVESMSFAFAGKEEEFAGPEFFKNWEKEGERIRSLKSGQLNKDNMNIDNEDILWDDEEEEKEDTGDDDESRMDVTD